MAKQTTSTATPGPSAEIGRTIKLDTFAVSTQTPSPTSLATPVSTRPPSSTLPPTPQSGGGSSCRQGETNNGGRCCYYEQTDGSITGSGISHLLTCCYTAGTAMNDFECNAKPVVYLYPTRPTMVDVMIHALGEVTVSIPHYPHDGWRNILAFPNGQLIYQGQSYDELFFETNTKVPERPSTGFIVDKDSIVSTLQLITTQYGLTTSEQHELIDFWAPILRSQSSPYIQISVFTMKQKHLFDSLTIRPQPDTFIELSLFFKRHETKITLPPVVLPKTIPQRIGFTAVEWGGILDTP